MICPVPLDCAEPSSGIDGFEDSAEFDFRNRTDSFVKRAKHQDYHQFIFAMPIPRMPCVGPVETNGDQWSDESAVSQKSSEFPFHTDLEQLDNKTTANSARFNQWNAPAFIRLDEQSNIIKIYARTACIDDSGCSIDTQTKYVSNMSRISKPQEKVPFEFQFHFESCH